MPEWYLGRDGKKHGPYTLDQLREYAAEGRVMKDDLLWTAALVEWTRADRAPELASLFSIETTSAKTPDDLPKKETYSGPEQTGPEKRQEEPAKSLSAGPPKAGLRRRGAVYAAGLLALAGAAALLFFFFRGDGLKVEQLGKVGVDQSGGRFVSEEIEVAVSPSSLQSHLELELSRVTGWQSGFDEGAGDGPLYRLEGDLSALGGGEVKVTFPLTDDLLEGSTDRAELEEKIVILLVGEVYSPSAGGTFKAEQPIETTFDWDNGTISAVLPLEGVHGEPVALASLQSQQYMAKPQTETDARRVTDLIEFKPAKYRLGWRQATSSQGHFRILFPSDMPVDTMQALAEEMERQKLNLEKLGFTFGDRKFPIDVHLRKWLIGSSENGRYWRWPWPLSSNLSTVNLNQNLFTSPRLEAMHIASRTDGDTPWNRMVRVAGHELLHLAQYYGYQKSWSTYHWLDEAIAVWYELYAASDIYRGEMKYGGILPDAAVENLDFIYTPLYFPESPEKHGYGASLFITYMVNELQDPSLPARIVGEASKLDYADSYPGVALQNALSSRNKMVGDLWHGFLEQYLVYPSEGFAGLNTSSLWKGDLRLNSQGKGTDNDPYRYSFTGENTLKGISARAETMEHPQGQEAKLTLDFKLGGLSAYPFKLNFDGTGAGEPVEIRVNLTSDNVFMAVQVYGIPAGGGTPLKLACASDPVIAWTGTGSCSTGGAFDELLFIVMNTDDARIRTKEEINCNLEISVGPSDVDIEGTWIGEMVFEQVHYSGELTLRGVTYHADSDRSELGRKKHFAVQITRNEQGSYTFESDISIESHSITGTDISFALGWRRSGEYIRFNGVLDESGQTISGTFEGGHDDYGVMVSGSWTLRKQQ